MTYKMNNRQKKEAKLALLPRCLATVHGHVCERELGHGNGWNGDKHRHGGFSWTEAYAQQVRDQQTKDGES